jgi:hypothetical protein
LNKDLVKQYIKKAYKVEHYKDLTIEKMKECWSRLHEIGQDKGKTLDLYAASEEYRWRR